MLVKYRDPKCKKSHYYAQHVKRFYYCQHMKIQTSTSQLAIWHLNCYVLYKLEAYISELAIKHCNIHI